VHAESMLLVDDGKSQIAENRHLPKIRRACPPRCRFRPVPVEKGSPHGHCRVSRPVSARMRTPVASARGDSAAKCWRARISVGAISAACAPVSPPRSTSPASRRPFFQRRHRPGASRNMRVACGHVAPYFCEHLFLRRRERERQSAARARDEAAVAGQYSASPAAQPLADERER